MHEVNRCWCVDNCLCTRYICTYSGTLGQRPWYWQRNWLPLGWNACAPTCLQNSVGSSRRFLCTEVRWSLQYLPLPICPIINAKKPSEKACATWDESFCQGKVTGHAGRNIAFNRIPGPCFFSFGLKSVVRSLQHRTPAMSQKRDYTRCETQTWQQSRGRMVVEAHRRVTANNRAI